MAIVVSVFSVGERLVPASQLSLAAASSASQFPQGRKWRAGTSCSSGVRVATCIHFIQSSTLLNGVLKVTQCAG